LSTAFVIATYVYNWFPFYTNILYQLLPMEVWTIIAVGQYVFPMIILAQIHVTWKTWYYLLYYPLFIYSWIPITVIGFFHRHDHEWSHTAHTRSMRYQDVLISQKAEFSKEAVLSKQAAK